MSKSPENNRLADIFIVAFRPLNEHERRCVLFLILTLAWAALKRNIPILMLYGDYGTARLFHLKEPADLFTYPRRPTQEEMSSMLPGIQERLRAQGALHYFRDFLEWNEQTLAVASAQDSVNWLFKAHPCDDWYASIQGTRLEDLVTSTCQPHIRLADKTWNGLDLIHTLDGIVTCHGTIGIEATALGTPVLVVHPGWYGHAGFVINPASRDNYLAALRTEWWKTLDKEAARQHAELFAGWMFCVPNWHGNYTMQDDSRQDAIYSKLPVFLTDNATAMDREVQEIRDWFEAGHRYFHVFKVMRVGAF